MACVCSPAPERSCVTLKLALVHDYLNQRGGAERFFSFLSREWPDAPIYTALFDRALLGDLFDPARVRTSYLDRIPGGKRHFRYLAPLYPHAFERFDLSGYDVIVSSSSAWAKGVRFSPRTVHVSYIHTVSRFVFAYDEYVGGLGVGRIARPMVERLAAWDRRAAQRPTHLVANSHNVAQRIAQYYGRRAEVLQSPVDLARFEVGRGRGDYFFIASRLLPYKHIERAIAAAQSAGVRLYVAGTGPDEARLKALACGTSTTMLGYVDDATAAGLLGDARAAILPAEEDYGLLPLEAAASGRPTIALRAGGALETIVEGRTGEFFDEPTSQSLACRLRDFNPSQYDPMQLRAHAERFSPQQFVQAFRAIVERTVAEHRSA
ncbi:MAG: glycosyltransferase [Vulcanimicrobiaceae bacterium]